LPLKLTVPNWSEQAGEVVYNFLFEDELHQKHWTAGFRYK